MKIVNVLGAWLQFDLRVVSVGAMCEREKVSSVAHSLTFDSLESLGERVGEKDRKGNEEGSRGVGEEKSRRKLTRTKRLDGLVAMRRDAKKSIGILTANPTTSSES